MSKNFPDAVAEAKSYADFVLKWDAMNPEVALDRVVVDSPMLDKKAVRAGAVKFHKERMKAIPDAVKYPESKPWVEYVLTYEKEFQAATGFNETEMALSRSLSEYLCFRGFRECAAGKKKTGKGTGLAMSEKCRVVFDPNTDRGTLHAKNVDDPITHFKKSKVKPGFSPKGARRALLMDGTGSGLHLDVEPKEELFPLPMLRMCSYYNDTTPGALEFIQRYGKFWSGANIVVMDAENRSATVEKCARNYIEILHPDFTGRSHCSGMAVRNQDSPLAKHQRAMRAEYLSIFGLPNNPKETPDVAFWDACDVAERMLDWYMKKPGQITVEEYEQLLTRPFPHGLRKVGKMLHPKQSVAEYTLVTLLELWDERVYIRYQADETKGGEYPKKPEIYKG